jgi:hypothetical protein
MQQFAQQPQISVGQIAKQIDPAEIAEIELRRQIHSEDFHCIFTPV